MTEVATSSVAAHSTTKRDGRPGRTIKDLSSHVGLIRFDGHPCSEGHDVHTDGRHPRRRARRQFTDEFQPRAVRRVLVDGMATGAAARDFNLTETALREWGRQARADRTNGRRPAKGRFTRHLH